MKRFHIHVGVKDLKESVRFYTSLFGQDPVKLKDDYAKWMLDQPRLNFAISTRTGEVGVDHLGIQVDESPELNEITERLRAAELELKDEGETTCCYSRSNKAWVIDPSGIAWEAYQNMADAEVFHEVSEAEDGCCVPTQGVKSSCCPPADSSNQSSCC